MRKRSSYLVLLIWSIVACSALPAWQITYPKNYFKNLEKKRDKEAAVLWKELARGEVEKAICLYVGKNPSVDGVDIHNAASDLAWLRNGPRDFKLGQWKFFLSEWEYNPSIKKLDWGNVKLVASLSYDYKTKSLESQENSAEIRLYFKLRREGGWFSKKTLYAEFESADYGEIVIIIPFGGVELRKTPTAPL